MAAAVWVGNPHRPNDSLDGVPIGGRTYSPVFGATIGGPIWRDTMQSALVGVPVQPLPLADPKYLYGQTTTVPDVSGLSISDARATLQQDGFQPVVGSQVDSLLPAGTVAYTSPPAGSGAPHGSVIVLRISNGVAPPAPRPSVTPTPPITP